MARDGQKMVCRVIVLVGVYPVQEVGYVVHGITILTNCIHCPVLPVRVFVISRGKRQQGSKWWSQP
jgi:hypothetical protein